MCKYLLIILSLLACFVTVQAQKKLPGAKEMNFPPAYSELRTDTARMRFLVSVIQDSLDESQLDPVLAWARAGLSMAEKKNTDTMKGIFYYYIGKAYTYAYNKYDSAIHYYKKVLPFFPDKMRKYHIFSIREIMDRYADLGNKDSSFAYMDMLKALIDTMTDANPKKVSLSQNIATCYQWFGMYRSAIRYFQVAINGNRQNKNFRGLGLAMANLSELYNSMEDHDKAIVYAKEALGYLADVNMPYMETAANIADHYADQKQNDSALLYLKKSDTVAHKVGNTEQLVTNEAILARIYINQGKYQEAKGILSKALLSQSQTDDTWNLCRTLLYSAQLDTTLRKYDDARRHLQQVLDISRNKEFRIYTVTALQNMALLLSKTGSYKEAMQYQLEYTRIKDSLSTTRAKTDLNDLEISYKTLQKEQEIALLKKDNDINRLKLQESNRQKIFYLMMLLFAVVLFSVIYYQRNRWNNMEMEKIKAELQTQVLRSQMNPHFIFNCLNSIENFIMQNDKRQASDYLNKFSQLIRTILDSNRNEVVPVVKDIEALKLYVELEQLRFNHKFKFTVYIDPALAGGDYMVPSLLVQPFVENAIVHGMAHSEEKDLNIVVKASLEGDKIKYVIEDNGVGREKAKVYNMQNKPYHKSVGLKITEERISIFNDQDAKEESIRIVDLYDENKNPEGTKVEIVLKAI